MTREERGMLIHLLKLSRILASVVKLNSLTKCGREAGARKERNVNVKEHMEIDTAHVMAKE